jgi:hypothetical protein
VLGGKGGAVMGAPVMVSQGATPYPASALPTDSGMLYNEFGGGGSSGGGGSGSPTQYVSDEEEITPPGQELLDKAISGKLNAREWLVYGGLAVGALALGVAAYRRYKRGRG